jgi:glutathione S-transferase
VLYESNAIVEYVEEAYPGRGAPLFPGDAKMRAIVRRFILEVDNYFYKAIDPVLDQAFWKKPDERDADTLAEGRKSSVDELAMFTNAMRGDYLAGPLSAADFAFYPLVAFLYPAQKMKLPALDADGGSHLSCGRGRRASRRCRSSTRPSRRTGRRRRSLWVRIHSDFREQVGSTRPDESG